MLLVWPVKKIKKKITKTNTVEVEDTSFLQIHFKKKTVNFNSSQFQLSSDNVAESPHDKSNTRGALQKVAPQWHWGQLQQVLTLTLPTLTKSLDMLPHRSRLVDQKKGIVTRNMNHPFSQRTPGLHPFSLRPTVQQVCAEHQAGKGVKRAQVSTENSFWANGYSSLVVQWLRISLKSDIGNVKKEVAIYLSLEKKNWTLDLRSPNSALRRWERGEEWASVRRGKQDPEHKRWEAGWPGQWCMWPGRWHVWATGK